MTRHFLSSQKNVVFSNALFYIEYFDTIHVHKVVFTAFYGICKYTVVRSFNALQWRHNKRDGVSNHQPQDCLLDRLFRCRSKTTSKRRVTGLCDGNSAVNGEFPTQRASNAENVSVWWRHHATTRPLCETVGCKAKYCVSYNLVHKK